MMVGDYVEPMRVRNITVPIEPPNLRTGAGHGHFRKFNREKPKKDAWAKKQKKAKMRKASRKRNRRGRGKQC